MTALLIGMSSLMLALGTASTTIAWLIRGRLDAMDARLAMLRAG